MTQLQQEQASSAAALAQMQAAARHGDELGAEMQQLRDELAAELQQLEAEYATQTAKLQVSTCLTVTVSHAFC